MARSRRLSPGGVAYHAMNRCVAGLALFEDEGDYVAFERVLGEAVERFPAMRVCAYCLMPNHFHLVLWPRKDEVLSRFMQWLSMTHTQRWHAHRHSVGRGHLYQGRFKSFPIQRDEHFLAVCRYVERNPLRAGLVRKAEAWRWGSLTARGDAERAGVLCDAWPTGRPRNWLEIVNAPQSPGELEALRRCVNRGSPFGAPAWSAKTAQVMGLVSTTRPRGRPKREG